MLISSQAGALTTNDLRYVTAGLPQWNKAWATIPPGLGYADSTNAKININDNSNLNVNTLTSIINRNLNQFSNRSGGMDGSNYLETLAANIVDYCDTNSAPTTNGSTVGYDNYPLPVVFSDQISWKRDAIPSNSTITVTTYIQFWNCSTLTSPAISYTLQNNFQDRYLKASGAISPVRIFSNSLTNQLSVPALGPNQIIILTTTNTTSVGVNASYPGGLMITNQLGINDNSSTAYATNTNLFELRAGNTIISQHKGSFTRIGQKITNNSWDFEGTVLTMSRDKTTPAPIGDPRMLRFLSNPPAIPLEYRSSSSGNLKWGGYANFKDHGPSSGPWNGHPDNWPDGRSSSLAPLTGTGQSGGAGGSIPTPTGTPLTLPGTAPAILSTNGRFLTVTELGNVFDPIQWRPPNSFTRNNQYVGASIDSSWTSNSLYGGGTTLRIGRWEFSRFAFTNMGAGSAPAPNMMMSAAALLDIFSVTNSDGRYDEGGRINLNTAPAPVLRALAGGVILTNDPEQKPANLAVPPAMAEAFAQGVMRFRSKYPFYSPSQLAFLGTDPTWPNTNTWPTNSVFGNTNTIALSTAPGNSFGSSAKLSVTEWNDLAAEEWFSKIYNLATTQSRNYRVYVIAQLVDTNGNPTGQTARKYYHIFARNNKQDPNDGDGASTYCVYESPY